MEGNPVTKPTIHWDGLYLPGKLEEVLVLHLQIVMVISDHRLQKRGERCRKRFMKKMHPSTPAIAAATQRESQPGC
jgi:hypothetical protein